MIRVDSYQVDERIQDFMSKKASKKHLGYVMTDRLLGNTRHAPAGRSSRSMRDYEPLPWLSTRR